MSLPPLLLERLKKRGIIKEQNEESLLKPCSSETSTKKLPVIGCPNKYNIYHDCGTYCELKFGLGMNEPSPKIKEIYKTLIENYPLNGWRSVWDCGCARFYFYNIDTKEVSWYPPGHPKFRSTKSANVLRAERDEINRTDSNNIADEKSKNNKINQQLDQFDKEINSEMNMDFDQKSNSGGPNKEFNEKNGELKNEQFDEDSNDSNENYSDEQSNSDQKSNSEQSSDEN